MDAGERVNSTRGKSSWVDLQVGKGLVVFLQRVEPGLHILDQPAFQQQGIDLAVGLEIVDVADFLHEIGGPAVEFSSLEEIVARPAPQILGLADINHPPGRVLHQVDAGRLGKLPHLPGSRRAVAGGRRGIGVGGQGLSGWVGSGVHDSIVAQPVPHKAGWDTSQQRRLVGEQGSPSSS